QSSRTCDGGPRGAQAFFIRPPPGPVGSGHPRGSDPRGFRPRPERRKGLRILGRVKVTLPDGKALELPDGATGLDAARAIGPKLAEQAVLVKSNGVVQDVRAPLQDGAPLQILT